MGDGSFFWTSAQSINEMSAKPDVVLRNRCSLNCVRFKGSDSLLSGDGNGVVRLWDLRTQRIAFELDLSSPNSCDKK